jgi:flagella basal body P-ring formation protein FlgA
MRRLVILALGLPAVWLATLPSVLAQEVLAARTLRAGTVIEAADLKLGDAAAAGARTQLDELVGLETRRAIYSGRPVTPADLGPPTLVRRNAVVTMVYIRRGLDIRTEGRALEPGGAGEPVRVMNLASRQPVLATVAGENRVEVTR